MICPRCHKPITGFTMSRFNTEDICLDCEAAEKKHPKYKEAHDAELTAVKSGDYNFPGIGCPSDLYL
jgi:hypothetical protein